MQSKRGELVPIAEAFSDLSGPVAALRDASPQARHHFTQADQVNQLASSNVCAAAIGMPSSTASSAKATMPRRISRFLMHVCSIRGSGTSLS